MSTHNYKCPKCGSTTIALERRMNGDAICSDCRHRDVAVKFVDNQLFFNTGYDVSGHESFSAKVKDIGADACVSFERRKDKFFKDFLAERGIGIEQIMQDGVVRHSNGDAKISYQGRDLIVFCAPQIVKDGSTITFRQEYIILEEKP